MRSLFLCFCLCLFMGIAAGTANAEIMGDYLGAAACAECHEDVFEGWKTTPHAHAFDTLKEQGEEKQTISGCVKCHVVAFEKDGGFIDKTLTPELKDVQCESCHGPARRHVEADGDPEEILAQPNEALCRTCHTEGQDKNFDYAVKKLFVHGGGEDATATAKAAEQIHGSGRLVADVQRVAFGNMTEGVVAKKQVQLKNSGNAPLKISNVTTS